MKITWILIFLFLIFKLWAYGQEWQLAGMSKEMRKRTYIQCMENHEGWFLYYKVKGSHINIMFLDNNENIVRCK
jgi:hypothetical protein